MVVLLSAAATMRQQQLAAALRPNFAVGRLRGGVEQYPNGVRHPPNGEWDFVDSPHEEAFPTIQMEPGNAHMTKEEWEREVFGFKQEEALEWVDSLIAEADRFEMQGQTAGPDGEKRDNAAHVGCRCEAMGNNTFRLISHRMGSYDAGAEYGIFVDIEATSAPIELTAIRIAAHGLANKKSAWEPKELNFDVHARLEELSDPMTVSLYTCDGSSASKELNASAWERIGHEEDVRLPRINGKEDWEGQWREQWQDDPANGPGAGDWIYPERQEPVYASVPMDHPLVLQKGERRGFLIHTSCVVGVANRWPTGMGFRVGDKTDADEHVQLYAMRAMPEEKPFTEEEEEQWEHPCTGEREPTSAALRRLKGHAFVGEIEYTVLAPAGDKGQTEMGQRRGTGKRSRERETLTDTTVSAS